ncbi:YsnF/AvaK domain-containing protein [Microvirga sp. BT689]|uniref:YsnF/AvaK domain-containing protein n=1 Tax=Microvirga arvi TaxID=2778731 RepID=UPI001951D694|nr:YsnF/AvaK domain-containing protein [Microvirga arvi]MBM6579011.1 YsnF/AvaK domain-containing protein [Microvirga arvi]
MAKTVTCLFSSDSQASSIVRELAQSGISQGKICLFTASGENRTWDGASNFDESSSGSHHDRVENYLTTNGVPHDDARAYAEGVRRGHALIAVRCDDDEVDRVVDILDDDDVLDLDEQQDAWRSEGWSHQDSGVADLGGTATTSAGVLGTGLTGGGTRDRESLQDDSLYARDRSSDRDEVIPVAEEELHVGKREVSHGRVRIRSHVTERPVQEQVSLKEERVSVERRPVEGTARTGSVNDGDLFRERSIEMEERSEEAVVSKEARVVEEVVVRKDADQRTETISDTVRKTEVEVDDERSAGISRTGTTDKNR